MAGARPRALGGELCLSLGVDRTGRLTQGQVPAGNLWRACALKQMTYENRTIPPRSREERAALMEKRREDAEQALVERKQADEAFRANYERLKAERLAREAAANS